MEIALQELGRYILMGIGSRNVKILGQEMMQTRFWFLCLMKLKGGFMMKRSMQLSKKGNPYLENGRMISTQKKVTIVAYEKYMERLGKIVYRRNVIYKSVSFETEAKNQNRDYSYAHRLLFAESLRPLHT